MIDSAECYRQAHSYKSMARSSDNPMFASVSQTTGGNTRSPRKGRPRDNRMQGHGYSPRAHSVLGRGSSEV